MFLCLWHHIVFDTRRYVYMELDIDKLVLLRLQKIPIGVSVKVSDIAKRDPSGFVQAVKRLIRAGWCEYEFTNDYSGVKRLDLPDFARDYFQKLKDEYTKKSGGRSSSDENRSQITDIPRTSTP